MGFAVFEGLRLLDWGVSTYGRRGMNRRVMVSRTLNPLLDLHTPALVVLRKKKVSVVIGKALAPIMQILRKEGVRRSIGLRFLTTETVKRFFVARGCKTKHQVASALATQYPELAWKLPAKRKPWETEKHSMTIFDAAALGVCFVGAVLEGAAPV
jgi:hypothetical protein